MAEEKPFDPTHARIAKARRDGDIPRSADVNAVASLACASLGLFLILDLAAGAARTALAQAASGRAIDPGPYVVFGLVALAVIACALVGAVAATYAQARTITVKFPAPKFEKLNPFEGLKRMLSRDAAIGGAKAFVVSVAVACAVVPAGRDTFAAVAGAASPAQLGAIVVRAIRAVLVAALLVAAAFAVVDMFLERAKWRKRLKMSFDELKRDSKQNDGDPLVRGRRRQAHRALVRGSIANVKNASFVITNPTHVAIALEYRPPAIAVPRVLVRAIDAGAQEIKRRARELGVPIVENVPLARALLASTDVGAPIPPGAYAAVAAIVAMLAREPVRA